MAQFTVRVELHGAKWEDYERLHAEMERKGFSRLIKADDGKTYHLPWAEYNGFGSLTNFQIRARRRTVQADGTQSWSPNPVVAVGSG